MSVYCLHLRRAAGGGQRGGLFWCAFESAAATALTAPTVASASSHCMHKLIYSSPGTLALCGPAPPLPLPPPFATSGQRRLRRRLAMQRQALCQPGQQQQVGGGGGVTSRSPAPPAPSAGGGTAGGTSTVMINMWRRSCV
jgi:hypothetical protein